jgi:hypothetical protein
VTSLGVENKTIWMKIEKAKLDSNKKQNYMIDFFLTQVKYTGTLTLGIMTFNIKTLRITIKLCDTNHKDTQHSNT